MIESIVNGFNAVISFIKAIADFIYNVVSGGLKLLSSIPDIINVMSSTFGMVPTIIVSVALFCLMVRVITIIINHKAGE